MKAGKRDGSGMVFTAARRDGPTPPVLSEKVNPVTGTFGECKVIRSVVPKSELEPELVKVGDDPIFQKVFGALEQLRVEEALNCRQKRREEYGEFFNLDSSGNRTHELKYGHGRFGAYFHSIHPADMTFATLVSAWYGSSDRSIFPILTTGYTKPCRHPNIYVREDSMAVCPDCGVRGPA